MSENELKIYIDKLWVDYHGGLDRIAEGKDGGQMDNFKELVKEIRKTVYEDIYKVMKPVECLDAYVISGNDWYIKSKS